MALCIAKLVGALGVVKEKGFSVLQSVLALIFLAVIGKKRLSKAENLKDHGIAALAGFASLPLQKLFLRLLGQDHPGRRREF